MGERPVFRLCLGYVRAPFVKGAPVSEKNIYESAISICLRNPPINASLTTLRNQVPGHLRPIFKFLHESFIFFLKDCTVVYSSTFATIFLSFVILGTVFAPP